MLFRPLIVALFALIASTTGVLAHAGLISADPADGVILRAAPVGVTLTFTEPVSPIGFSVVGLDGPARRLNADKQDGASVHVPLPADLAKGSYLFSWRVTSEDGHPVGGTIGFAVGAPSGSIAGPPSDPAVVAGIWLARLLQYVALFLGVGSAAFGALAGSAGGARSIARALSIGGVILVAPALGLQGVDMLGLPLGTMFTAAPWVEAVTNPYARTQALLALAFILALLPGRAAAVAAACAGALAPTLSGHASTATPYLLMRAALFVHIVSLMFWLGALIPLAGLLRQGDRAALHRFSRVIAWVIAALLTSGFILALVQLGPPRAEWLGPYGLLLGAKLALVVLLLLLALWNRVRLATRADAGDTLPLRRSIVLELALAVAILGVVAGWRFTTPPRVLAEIDAAAAPITVQLAAPQATASLLATPGRPGRVHLDLALPMAAETVTILLENPAQDIATVRQSAIHGVDRDWHVDDLMLPAGGDWSVAVEARTGKFDLTTFSGTLSFPGKDPMNTATRIAATAASSILLATPVWAAGILPSCPSGQSFAHGAITVSGAFSRATPPNAQSAGGYLTIHNGGPTADALVSVTSDAAKDVSIHQMKMNGNVMEMSAVQNGLPIPAGGTVSLDPMGYHLMLTGMAAPFVAGECLEMTLHFAQAGDLKVQLNIGGYAQNVPPTNGAPTVSSSMDMSGTSSMSSMQGM